MIQTTFRVYVNWFIRGMIIGTIIMSVVLIAVAIVVDDMISGVVLSAVVYFATREMPAFGDVNISDVRKFGRIIVYRVERKVEAGRTISLLGMYAVPVLVYVWYVIRLVTR